MTHYYELNVITSDGDKWTDTYEWEPDNETLEHAVAEMIAETKRTWNCKSVLFNRSFVE